MAQGGRVMNRLLLIVGLWILLGAGSCQGVHSDEEDTAFFKGRNAGQEWARQHPGVNGAYWDQNYDNFLVSIYGENYSDYIDGFLEGMRQIRKKEGDVHGGGGGGGGGAGM
jgi:hypothetical protein